MRIQTQARKTLQFVIKIITLIALLCFLFAAWFRTSVQRQNSYRLDILQLALQLSSDEPDAAEVLRVLAESMDHNKDFELADTCRQFQARQDSLEAFYQRIELMQEPTN